MENQNNETQNLNPAPQVSQTIQTPHVPPVSKPRPKLPLAAIIGIIIFLLLAGSAAGFYAFKPQIEKLISKPTPTITVQISPSPTASSSVDTSNWKTYTGNEYSFKYPNDYVIEPKDSYTLIVATPGAELFAIQKEQLAPQQTKNYLGLPTIGQTTINGNTWTIVSGMYGDMLSPAKRIFVYQLIKNDVRYSFQFLNNTSTLTSIENQILSTFKFTDSQTADTSSWTTQKSKYCNVNFKVPPRKAPYITYFQDVTNNPKYEQYWQVREFSAPDKSNDGNSLFKTGTYLVLAADNEASDTITGMVSIECTSSNTASLDKIPEAYISAFGSNLGLRVRKKSTDTKWGHQVEVAQFDGGLFGDKEIYFIKTNSEIYKIYERIDSKDPFIKLTTDTIFNSLQFTN